MVGAFKNVLMSLSGACCNKVTRGRGLWMVSLNGYEEYVQHCLGVGSLIVFRFYTPEKIIDPHKCLFHTVTVIDVFFI